MRKIVLTGGGTAGHVLPNIALLPSLRPLYDEIIYLGGQGIEKQIAKENGLPYYEITTVKLRRKLTLQNFLIPIKLVRALREAKKILRAVQPTVVFSKGGYVALPVVIAAKKLGIKVIAHESDLTLGLANRLTVKYCTQLCTTFPVTAERYPQAVATGAIIRQEIYHGDKTKINLPVNGKINLLIMGGSLGAKAINKIVWATLPMLLGGYNVLHLTGRGKSNPNYQQPNYLQLEYLSAPQDAFAWADLVIARAGSGTVCELLALRKPALYIPLPKAESRGDQIQNAHYLQDLGVCRVLPQNELTPEILLRELRKLKQQQDSIIANCAKQTWVDGTQRVVNYLR